jgi:uncharacterized protein
VTHYEEHTLKSKLLYLYSLQIIDSQLDELEELKGDLPAAVRSMEAKLEELTQQRQNLDQSMKQAFTLRDEADSTIVGLRAKLEKYKTQQYSVRTNREYDALTREMDSAAETITRLEAEMESHELKATRSRSDIEEMKPKIEDQQAQLKEKREALAEVSKSTEDEELKLHHERQKLVARVGKADLAAYERIRKARNGKAVVPVRKGSCGGCFNRVPPQKLLELRQNAKVYTCERCGRIIISDEIAESVAKGE